jgi:hypothetical protein
LASTGQSIATGVDWITPSSHGRVLAKDIAIGAFNTVTITYWARRKPKDP